jgi:phytoene/squalene synthetase
VPATKPHPVGVGERASTAADARFCRRIHGRGVVFVWANRLLTPERRPHMHALAALCRAADEVFDRVDVTADRRAGDLDRLVADFRAKAPIVLAAWST